VCDRDLRLEAVDLKFDRLRNATAVQPDFIEPFEPPDRGYVQFLALRRETGALQRLFKIQKWRAHQAYFLMLTYIEGVIKQRIIVVTLIEFVINDNITDFYIALVFVFFTENKPVKMSNTHVGCNSLKVVTYGWVIISIFIESETA
jgi:hypothetical protein